MQGDEGESKGEGGEGGEGGKGGEGAAGVSCVSTNTCRARGLTILANISLIATSTKTGVCTKTLRGTTVSQVAAYFPHGLFL